MGTTLGSRERRLNMLFKIFVASLVMAVFSMAVGYFGSMLFLYTQIRGFR